MRPLLTVLLCLALSANVAALAGQALPEAPTPEAGAPVAPDHREPVDRAGAAAKARSAALVDRLDESAPAGVPLVDGSVVADADARAGAGLATAKATAETVRKDSEAILADALADPLAFAEGTIIRPAEKEVGRITSTIVLEQGDDGAAQDDTEPLASTAASEPFLSMPMLIAGATAAAAAAGAIVAWFAGSSGAVGTGAKAMGGELRRVLPYASPLFTRFEKDTVMGHPKREELYATIVDEPGVPLHALCKRTGLSRTAVLHHLRLLEHHHVIVSRRVGRSRHYFENGGRYGKDQKEAYAVLQNDRSRSVAQFIRDHPGTIQKRMCDALGLQASIAHWHVRRLQEASLVEPIRQGRTVSYFPTADLQQLA